MPKGDEAPVLALTQTFFRASVKSPRLSVPHFPPIPGDGLLAWLDDVSTSNLVPGFVPGDRT